MRFLVDGGSYAEIGAAWQRYMSYLDVVHARMPARALEFARAKWHYDPRHHRALHDSWLQEIRVFDASLKGNESDGARIILELLGAYHDGVTRLEYKGVRGYSLVSAFEARLTHPGKPLHDDLIIDEVTLSDTGEVVHEIVFRSGSTFVITCIDLVYSTTIPDVTER